MYALCELARGCVSFGTLSADYLHNLRIFFETNIGFPRIAARAYLMKQWPEIPIRNRPIPMARVQPALNVCVCLLNYCRVANGKSRAIKMNLLHFSVNLPL